MDEKNASRWALFTREERESIKDTLETVAMEWNADEMDEIDSNICEEIEFINDLEGRRG